MALISVDELARRIGERSVSVVDVRWYLGLPGAGRAEYEAGHVPTAIHLDLDDDLSARSGPGRHPLPSPHAFRDRMAAAGIGTHSLVVAYDDAGGTVAARLWWMLDNLGHRGGVAVLDGGIQAWTAAGRELSIDVPRPAPASLELADEWRGVVDRAALDQRLGRLTLLDARAPERYRGEVEPIDPVAGHIPTAINAPTAGNLDSDGRFLPRVDLRRRYIDIHAQGGGPIVTSCGSGTTACHNALAMRIAGLPDPLLYVGSYSDWSTAGMPIATGEEPGAAPARAAAAVADPQITGAAD